MRPETWASDSDHWYNRSGAACHTVMSKKGTPRPTTLRDARTLDLAPSVTKITGCAARPGLENWKGEQLIMASLTLRRGADETDKQWIARIRADASEQAKQAAERGTAIHYAIEKHLRGEPYDPEFKPYVSGAMRALSILDLSGQRPERSFTSPLGYGGKVDLHTSAHVIDFKTKDGDLADVECYPEHWMQVAAYAQGLGMPAPECGNLFVSRTQPGEARLLMHNQNDTERGWRMFRALLQYWFTANEYRPSWAVQAIEAA